jgi:hypothetical protein
LNNLDFAHKRSSDRPSQNPIVELGKTRILAASAVLTMACFTCPLLNIYRHPLPKNPMILRQKSGYVPISIVLLIGHIPIRRLLHRVKPNLTGAHRIMLQMMLINVATY